MNARKPAAPQRVLALGLDPDRIDPAETGGLDPKLVRAFIEQQLDRVRSLGYTVDACLVDPADGAETITLHRLAMAHYDCVLIGAGLRDEARLLLFERLLNLIHENAPSARICFNTSPADTAEAVKRWI